MTKPSWICTAPACENAQARNGRCLTHQGRPTAKPRTKFCPRCRVELPESAFTRNSMAEDGLQWHCRACRKAGRERKQAWSVMRTVDVGGEL